MSLTQDDLKNIDETISKRLKERDRDFFQRVALLLSKLPTRDDIEEMIEGKLQSLREDMLTLKDGLIAIRRELDIEHEFRYKRLESHDEQIQQNTKDIRGIKKVLQLKGSYE